jgi:hypothetical protein
VGEVGSGFAGEKFLERRKSYGVDHHSVK